MQKITVFCRFTQNASAHGPQNKKAARHPSGMGLLFIIIDRPARPFSSRWPGWR